MYTVKRLSKLACVSVRTLHYYDEIGLLKPASYGDNGYRYYDDDAVLRLQQILFFKELDFSLEAIQTIIDKPDFDILHTLQSHKQALQHKVARFNHLIHTVDQTILHLEGQIDLSQKDMFDGFTEEQEKHYEQQAYERWGESVRETTKRWNAYSKAEKDKIKAEGKAVYQDMIAAMSKGHASAEVQAIVGRWHQHLRYFYEPSTERLRGLANLYNDDPEFLKTFTALHPALAPFFRDAINYYCDRLTN